MRRKSGFLILCLVSVFLFVCAVDLAHAAPPEGKGPKVKPVLLARTGQTTSYAPGDDGDLQMGVPSPTPRFIDNGDGTATDRLIGLTWTKDGSLYFIHWSDALSACNAYSVGTLDDWRMPNIRELQSLLDYEQSNPMLPVGHPFINIQMGVSTTGHLPPTPPGIRTMMSLLWPWTLVGRESGQRIPAVTCCVFGVTPQMIGLGRSEQILRRNRIFFFLAI